jgi:tetratricopeptide (TPR) repeat protein
MTGEYERARAFPAELQLDEQRGPASHLSRKKADAMISDALARAGFGEGGEVEPIIEEVSAEDVVTVPPALARRFAFWQLAALACLAFLGVGSASAAVMWFAKRKLEPTVEQLDAPRNKPSQRRAPVKVEAPEPQDLPAVLALDEVSIEAEKRQRRVEERKPEDWLEEGNQLRAQKRWKEADEAYARVWKTAPGSGAAYVARIASASIRLDHLGDPQTALSRYRSALQTSGHGALSEEARFGIAEAYRRMGDRAQELEALRAFLQQHPSAGLAPRAKARLKTLGAGQ